MNQMASVHELLKRVTDKLGLPSEDYFLYCQSTSGDGFIPDRNDILDTLVCFRCFSVDYVIDLHLR